MIDDGELQTKHLLGRKHKLILIIIIIIIINSTTAGKYIDR